MARNLAIEAAAAKIGVGLLWTTTSEVSVYLMLPGTAEFVAIEAPAVDMNQGGMDASFGTFIADNML